MTGMGFGEEVLGGLPILRCEYELTDDVDPMESYERIYLHNTFKHTDIEELLAYSLDRGFAGIGYHFAIDPEGRVFATRPLDVQGAHVYGRNQESVGIVFLDVNKCADSPFAIQHFRKLYEYLSPQRDLPVLSHTYGLFERVNLLIAEHNESGEGPRVDPLSFDHMVCTLEGFAHSRAEASAAIRPITLARKEEQRTKLERAVDDLKICPGPQFLRIMHEAGIDLHRETSQRAC